MDRFCDWVKENMYVDPAQKDIQDISEAVRIFTNRIVCQFNKLSENCTIKHLIPCGSMVEGTKIWGKHVRYVHYNTHPRHRIIDVPQEIEFDYLAVIESKAPGDNICEEICKEHVQFLDSKYDDTEKYLELFKINVLQAISTLCKCFTLELYEEADDIYFSNKNANAGCEKCRVEMETGALTVNAGVSLGYSVLQNLHISFHWIYKENALAKPLIASDFNIVMDNVTKLEILLDLNPAIKIDIIGEKTQVKPELISDKNSLTEELYAFPKKCENSHKSCWRISRCITEVCAFKTANLEHKLCYMSLKIISIFCIFSSSLNTYNIKTVILNHMKTCCEANTSKCLIAVTRSLAENLKTVKMLKADTDHNLFWNLSQSYQNDLKLQGNLFEIVSQPYIWGEDIVYNLKLLTSLSFLFSSADFGCYYKCKSKENVIYALKGILIKHKLKWDLREIRLECQNIFKENFELE